MKQRIKLNESQLRDMISEELKLMLEYRASDGFENYELDGDAFANLPGESKGKFTGFDNIGKRSKTKGKFMVYPSIYDEGKGKMLWKLQEEINQLLNSKVEWTEDEKEDLKDIKLRICHLARKTKLNGNRKRGYLGKQSDN